MPLNCPIEANAKCKIGRPNSQLILSLTKSQFISEVAKGQGAPPLYVELPYEIPAEIYPSVASTPGVLLESTKGSPSLARYSFIAIEPYARYSIKDCVAQAEGFEPTFGAHPLSVLRAMVEGYRQRPLPELPPFQGGAVVLLCYDFVRYLERIPDTVEDDQGLPDMDVLMVDRVLAFDHVQKRLWAICAPGAREVGGADWARYYDEAHEALETIAQRLKVTSAAPSSGLLKSLDIRHDVSREHYVGMVARAKQYIAAGDIFQANLSLRVSAYIGDLSPWQLYLALRSINPSPFAGYLDMGDYHIVSSSPERLVRVHEGIVDTRPIAGTRPRGKDTQEDHAMRAELLLNEKERAEHIMLIDLERNDLGKVCAYGTVEVDELMVTEQYSHVIHIVSNVRGALAPGKNIASVIRAVFPGGTITGVPKIRCMEIIDELETLRRGAYTGSFGYIGFSGASDLNIIIRTFVVKDGEARVQAGAGIVADSDPEREYHESLKKAEALIRTLEMLARG